MAEAAAAASPTPDAAGEDTLVQFIVLRRDLLKTMEWPVGSVVAQACHASLAVIWENRADASVAAYLSPENIASMHKVTKEVRRGATSVRRQRPSLDRPPPPRSAPQVKGEPQLLTLAEKLRAEGVVHKLWVEQPENIPTAIALKPYPRSHVAHLLKKYQLFK